MKSTTAAQSLSVQANTKAIMPIGLRETALKLAEAEQQLVASWFDQLKALKSELSARVQSYVGQLSDTVTAPKDSKKASAEEWLCDRERQLGPLAAVAGVYSCLLKEGCQDIRKQLQKAEIHLATEERGKLLKALQTFETDLSGFVFEKMPRDTRALMKFSGHNETVAFHIKRVFDTYEWEPNPTYGQEILTPADSRIIDQDPGSYVSAGTSRDTFSKSLPSSQVFERVASRLAKKWPQDAPDRFSATVIPQPEQCMKLIRTAAEELAKEVSDQALSESVPRYGNTRECRFSHIETPEFDLKKMAAQLIDGAPTERLSELIEFRRKMQAVSTGV